MSTNNGVKLTGETMNYDEEFITLANEIAENEKRLSKDNPIRISIVRILTSFLRTSLADCDCVKITSHNNSLAPSMGVIKIVGNKINLSTPALLAVLGYSSGITIIPRTDDKMEMDIFFYGLKELDDKYEEDLRAFIELEESMI